MSWLFSQVLVEEYLGDIYSDGEQSVQSNGKPTQQAYLLQDKMTKYSRLSQFGMTYKPLTENLGEELLTLYLEDFHAKTSQSQETEMDLTVNGQECGERWQGLLARLDQNTLLWKIPQCSLLEDSEQSLEIWPRWGTMRNGVCWEQPTLELHINEIESGLLPTPTASSMPCEGTVRIMRKQWLEGNYTLAEASAIAGRDVRKSQGKVKAYPTPDANMGNRGTQAEWTAIRKSGHSAQYPLNQALRDLTGKIGKPNPTWTEWLMGWPMQWTDLKPLEMDKYHFVQQLHGTSLKEE